MQTTLVLTFMQDVTRAFVESLTRDQVRPSCLHIELRRSYVQHPLFVSLMRYTGNTPTQTPPQQTFLDLLDRIAYLAKLLDPDVEIDYLYVKDRHVHTSSQPLWVYHDTIYHQEELYNLLYAQYQVYCQEADLTPEPHPTLLDMASCLPHCIIYQPRHLPWSDPYHDTID